MAALIALRQGPYARDQPESDPNVRPLHVTCGDAQGLHRRAHFRTFILHIKRGANSANQHPSKQPPPHAEEAGHTSGGFNIFRRFRITEPKKSDCPDALQHFWSGHAHAHVSERYVKLLQDREYRLEQAERIGLGLQRPVGLRGLLPVVPRVA